MNLKRQFRVMLIISAFAAQIPIITMMAFLGYPPSSSSFVVLLPAFALFLSVMLRTPDRKDTDHD